MINSLAAATMRLKFLVLTVGAIVIGAAALIVPRSVAEALPEFTPTYVEVQTEALGLSANEVEQMVTVPLEADLLNGVQDVSVIRSQSLTGLSRIVMVFKDGIDEYVARARVQEKLTQSAALPQVSKPPTMLQPLATESRLMMFTMEPETITPIETSVLARWTVRPRLLGIPGVANVAVWGNRERQLQVQVNPEQLKSKGVTLTQIVESVGNAQIVSPLTFLEASTPGTGGFIETPQQRLQVRHVFDKLATPEQMARIPIVEADNVQVKDVATVVEDHQPLIGDAVTGGKPGSLLIVVEKFAGANTVEVTNAVQAALDEMKPGLVGVKIDADHFRASDYVAGGLQNLALAFLLGFVLVVAAVGLVFRDWRASVLTAVSVATGTSLAALILHFVGQEQNLLSLSGVAAGSVVLAVDAAGASARSGSGSDTLRSPSRGAVGLATMIGLLTVIPLFALQGRPGALLRWVPLAFAATAVASWLVSALMSGALAGLLGPVGRELRVPAAVEGPLAKVSGTVARVGLGALAIVALLGVGLAPKALAPAFVGRDVVVSLDAAPGTSLPAMSASVNEATTRIRTTPGVQTVLGHVGRAITGDQIVDVNSAQLWVRLTPDADATRAIQDIANIGKNLAGVTVSVDSYSASRLRAVGTLLGGRAPSIAGLDLVTGIDHPLVVRVYGESQEVLNAKATEIQQALTSVSGIVSPTVVVPPTQDGVEITVDLQKARAHGIKPGDVRRAEAILVQGIQVGSVFEGQKVFDVIVLGDKSTRASVEAIKNLWIDAPAGGHVKLGDVADVAIRKVPVVIQRDAVARYVDVVADVSGDASSAAEGARKAVASVTFPLEHHAEVLTQSTGTEMGLSTAVWVGLAALVGIFLLLQAGAASWRNGLLAFVSTLASVSGGAVVAAVFGVSLGTLLGLLVLLAIGARFALWTLQRAGGELGEPAEGVAARGAIVGATVAAAVFVLPAAIMSSRPGLEVLGIFSWTVLVGLITTLVAALALPTAALHAAGGKS